MDELMSDSVVAMDVYTLRQDVPEFSDSRHQVPFREAMWVRLTTQEGLKGWGEAAVWGGPASVTSAILRHELFPMVRGQDSSAIHYLWERMYQQTAQHGRRGAIVAAMGAIDIALWDILAIRAGLPLVDVLGRMSSKVQPYASAGFYAPSKTLKDLVAEMTRLRSIGFRAFKMKIGRQNRKWSRVWERPNTYTLAEDVERVMAVREAIGEESTLLVDANTEWDAPTATQFLDRIQQANVFFLEEPVSADHYQHASRIRGRTGVRIAGFETEYTRFAYRDLLAAGALDVVQPDPCWCGGLSEARRIAAMASAYGALTVPHSFSSAMAVHINAHFVASLDNGFLVEWDSTGNPFVDPFLDPRERLDQDGWMAVPEGAGIGFSPNVEDVAGIQLVERVE
jgi:D-galactarolactone cycloisomerase